MGLLNVDGYYNSLLSFIDKAVDEGFIAPAARYIIVSAQTAHELMCKLEVLFFFFLVIFIFCFEPIKDAHVKHNLWVAIKTVKSSQLIGAVHFHQEYVPKHSGVASNLSWEMEQQLGYTNKSDIAR